MLILDKKQIKKEKLRLIQGFSFFLIAVAPFTEALYKYRFVLLCSLTRRKSRRELIFVSYLFLMVDLSDLTGEKGAYHGYRKIHHQQ